MTDNVIDSELLFPHAILGYRAWWRDGTRLYSITDARDGAWIPGVSTAICKSVPDPKALQLSEHQPPVANCGCGFYAYHDLAQVLRRRGKDKDAMVIGAVAGSGKVFIHRQGFRCRQIQILGLLADADADGIVAVLGKHYQVPTFDTTDQLKEHVGRLGVFAASDDLLYSQGRLKRLREKMKVRRSRSWWF